MTFSLDCSGISVLVIDDQKMSVKLIRDNLLAMGFADVDTAASSAEAEEKMVVRSYDIIFIDWVMPGKSGYALMQECRQNRAYDHVAFVMVTGQSGVREMAEAIKAGASSYIVKPAIPSEIQPKIQATVEWLLKNNPRFKRDE